MEHSLSFKLAKKNCKSKYNELFCALGMNVKLHLAMELFDNCSNLVIPIWVTENCQNQKISELEIVRVRKCRN